MRSITRLLPFLILAACGGTDPGSGTKTLYVRAKAVSDGSNQGTRLNVEVREGAESGAMIENAVVTVTSEKNTEHNLAWNGVRFGDFVLGSYVVQNIAWEGGYRIKVVRGEDKLEANLVGPGITTITEPLSATTFRRDSGPLTLKWKDALGRKADTVRVVFQDAAIDVTTEDDGEEQIEPNRLEVTRDERITVERTSSVELEGGAAGSKFEALTSHQIELIVE